MVSTIAIVCPNLALKADIIVGKLLQNANEFANGGDDITQLTGLAF